MPLQTSGPISASQIRDEFDGTTEFNFGEYYRGGNGRVLDTSINANVPTSGSISFSDFYGSSNQIYLDTVATPVVINGLNSLQEIIVSDYIPAGGTLVIPAGWWIWSDNTTVGAITVDVDCLIINEGNIIGRGGDGGGAVQSINGGPAIDNTGGHALEVINNSGAYIAGGGGGGGGAGGGGAGGGNGSLAGRYDGNVPSYTPNGGSLGQSGGSGNLGPSAGGVPGGGGAGGGGGNDADPRPTWGGYHGGGGGGRILPGTGGAGGANSTGGIGGNGGSAGNPGLDGWGGGGGGWGAAGGNSGGTGGAAISGSNTLTNNGTIYGAT